MLTFLKSNKTTIGGALLALGPIIKSFAPNGVIYWIGEGCQVVGAALLGQSAADSTSIKPSSFKPETK